MGNCTISLVQVPVDRKQELLDFIQREFSQNPYRYDNWGIYPKYSDWMEDTEPEQIRIGYLETKDTYMVRGSHSNSAPQQYKDFVKSIGGKFLFQDIDGYGENRIAWDLASEDLMSNVQYVMEFVQYYPNYTPFTAEFLFPIVKEATQRSEGSQYLISLSKGELSFP